MAPTKAMLQYPTHRWYQCMTGKQMTPVKLLSLHEKVDGTDEEYFIYQTSTGSVHMDKMSYLRNLKKLDEFFDPLKHIGQFVYDDPFSTEAYLRSLQTAIGVHLFKLDDKAREYTTDEYYIKANQKMAIPKKVRDLSAIVAFKVDSVRLEFSSLMADVEGAFEYTVPVELTSHVAMEKRVVNGVKHSVLRVKSKIDVDIHLDKSIVPEHSLPLWEKGMRHIVGSLSIDIHMCPGTGEIESTTKWSMDKRSSKARGLKYQVSTKSFFLEVAEPEPHMARFFVRNPVSTELLKEEYSNE